MMAVRVRHTALTWDLMSTLSRGILARGGNFKMFLLLP